MEIRGGNYFQPATACKALGAGSGEQHVPAVLHHLARGGDRVLDAAHGGHPSGAQRRSVHDAGVELDLSVAVRRGPTAWISISMPGRAKLLTVISALPG